MRALKTVLGAFIMVVTQNPIIGRSKQSMGSNTFTTYKGLNVLKTKPFSVANPKTLPQRQQRAALSTAVAVYRSLKSFFNVGFKQAINPLSPYNLFISTNVPVAFDVTDPDNVELSPSNFKASKGSLPVTSISTAVADDSDNNCIVTWSTSLSSPDYSATDKAYCLVYNDTSGDFIGTSMGTVNRSAGTLTIGSLTDMAASDFVYVYLFFLAADGLSVSDSDYLTTTVVA